jgi:hypothetical protein
MSDQAKALYNAMTHGRLWAATLQTGDLFQGCRPEASRRYPNEQTKVDMFISGALDVLDRTKLYVDDSGYITRLERIN